MCSPSIRPPEFIRDGRTVPSPEVTKIMAEMLKLGPADKLLEIGTGSASQTVEWAKSGCEVHTIDSLVAGRRHGHVNDVAKRCEPIPQE